MTGRAARTLQPLVWAAVPVLLLQGRRVRATTPRLPDATTPEGTAHPPGGTHSPDGVRLPEGAHRPDDASGGPPLHLLVLGDSTAAGVGVAVHADGIAGRLGAELAARTGRAVCWRAVARSGATAREVADRLLPAARTGPRPDLVLVLAGVNDVLRMTPVRAFGRAAAAIAAGAHAAWRAPVVFGDVPPLHRFPALPWPTRPLLGLRARALDAELARAARAAPRAAHAPLPMPADPARMFGPDGFHPGPEGYRIWAAHLAPTAARLTVGADGG
ncbi:SGNH/GDSL hydrolase family protein [Nocardiopsis trehalosi]|uniref:SGNH/GDSL hydrolase family protein n=1 Tax=Nocardiopsis trehalosi TaxID=109329 RepID=UPI000A06193F|nr:SGNH/GDSL hydrolase family protein [Nocardiopsis trehalosi]